MNATLSNLHTSCALGHFLLVFVFFVCLCCFSFWTCFHILHLLSQMLRLEFHVNQRGLKRHHWSTSSWLTAPLQPIQSKKGGDVTSTRLISCCNLYIGRNSPEGGQLKNQQPSKSPSSASAQKRAFSSCCGTKGMCGNASQRHSFISWLAKHPQRRYMDINVYSFSHMLVEYEY